MRSNQFVAAAVSVFLASAAFAQSKPAVDQQWAPGKYLVVSKFVTNHSGALEDLPNSEGESRYELLVREPDAKGQEVQVTFIHVGSQVKGGGVKDVDYDTDKPSEKDPYSLQSSVKAIIGVPMVTTIGTDGKVGEISGLDKIIKKSEAADDAMKTRTVVSLCNTMLTSSLECLRFHFPEEPIIKGYTWTRNVPLNIGMGALKMAESYKAKSVEDTPAGRVADLDFSAINTTNKLMAIDEDSTKLLKMVRVDEANNQVTGTIKANLDTRMVTYRKLHTKRTIKGASLMDGKNLPFTFATESDSEMVVTPAKNPPTNSTQPGQPKPPTSRTNNSR